MKSHLQLLLRELDRADLEDAVKAVIQREIETLLGRNAREILELIEVSEELAKEITKT